MDQNKLLNLPPFNMKKEEKAALFSRELTELTRLHRQNCPEYARLLRFLEFPENGTLEGEEIPMLPVSLFKELDLKSVPDDQVFKVLTSSGTSGQQVSKIYLDAETSGAQQRVLYRIVSDFIGESRIPLLVIDTKRVLRDRSLFSARGAGILGFSIFGAHTCYALDDNMELDLDGVVNFLQKYGEGPVLLFGFTYMIWKYFCRKLEELGERLEIPKGILIHGGGWKKLSGEAVSPDEFKERLRVVTGIRQVSNYYGMAEQTGCIYMECPCGHLHASVWSDVIPRRPRDYSPCEVGEPGVLQVLSMLPRSYPGHSLLTEDLGILLGEDDCPCGRAGKYFCVTGRVPKAEIRGCSDTYGG